METELSSLGPPTRKAHQLLPGGTETAQNGVLEGQGTEVFRTKIAFPCEGPEKHTGLPTAFANIHQRIIPDPH